MTDLNTMALDFFQYYFIGFTSNLLLLFFIRYNNSFSSKINNYFSAASTCGALLNITDWLRKYYAGLPTPGFGVNFSCAMGYILRPAAILMVLLIAIRHWPVKKKTLLFIPIVIDAFVALSGIFSDVCFYYDANNVFCRGPLYAVPFLVSGIYTVILIYTTFTSVRKTNRSEAYFILATAFVGTVFTVLEAFIRLYGLLPTGLAVSMILYYMFFHANLNNCDTLTGLLIRRRFYLDANAFGDTLSGVISMDMNGLKELNDNYGHEKGDAALIAVTHAASEALPKNRTRFYRTGGDEFMVLCRKSDEAEIQKTVSNLRTNISKTGYVCSIGYAVFRPGESFEEVCHRADALMYEDKIKTKGEEYRTKYTVSDTVKA